MLVCLLCTLLFSCVNQGAALQGTPQNSSPRVRVTWQTEKELRISGNEPVYPAIAIAAHVEGVVRLRAIISADGSTKELAYLSGPPLLMRSAMEAVRTWHFKPAAVNGIPVEVETNVFVYFFLGHSNASSSLSGYRKNVEKKPNDAKAHGDLAYELLAMEQIDESINEFRKALALRPKDADLHFGLGNALQANGDVDGAVAEYRQGLSIKPHDTTAHAAFAGLLEDGGNLDGAIAEYKTALQQEPRRSDLHYNLGRALTAKGDVDAAIQEFQHAIHEGFGGSETHYQLGIALEKKGEVHEALKEYKNAASQSPNEQKYRDARDRLAQTVQE
jgi:TonB family protein